MEFICKDQGSLMKKQQAGQFLIFLPLLFSVSTVLATPSSKTLPPFASKLIFPYQWKGFYLGATGGGVFSTFNTKTYTQAGPLLNPAQASAINNVGSQQINPSGFLSGIEGGYNWQFNRLLLGLETDIQSLSTNGETNTGAVPYPDQPGNQYVLTSYGNANWLLTARPRVGLTANNWLFYVTGGLGVIFQQNDFLFTNNLGALESKRVNKAKLGYVIGAGIEAALTQYLSLKAEYLFADFNNTSASNMNNNIPVGQTLTNVVNLKSNIIKLGINYHFNNAPMNFNLMPFDKNQWETELGTRIFVSSGTAGIPQPLLNTGMILASRLTFNNLTAISAETFAQADHASGLFAKGYLGAGTVTNGRLNDEDFPAGGAYSNTFSNTSGNLSYATLDLGYSFLKTSAAKTGMFIGYNYYAQNFNVYNCQQLAGAGICSAATSGLLNNFLVLTEDDKFNSFRLGFANQFNLTNQLTLISEAAYLPFVNFQGTDMHNVRQLIGPESSSHGDGAMLESSLNYQFAQSWDIGLGARYWMWNMHKGSVIFDFLGQTQTFNEPARFNTQRYGMFLKLSYRDRKPNPTDSFVALSDWKGFSIGAHMGGAWGQNNWSNPFGATNGSGSFINMPGYGNQIKSTGPLGGINLGYNWQKDILVYGIGGSISAADIRGENTLFSGLGGVNGQTIVNSLGTIVGKVGIANNRSLFYINGGRAVLNTKYFINGNTNALSLGAENQITSLWGWTGGAGIEYALTNHWSSNVEYNYIAIPNRAVSFSSLGIISNSRITANQSMNVFKLGLNYRFNLG